MKHLSFAMYCLTMSEPRRDLVEENKITAGKLTWNTAWWAVLVGHHPPFNQVLLG